LSQEKTEKAPVLEDIAIFACGHKEPDSSSLFSSENRG
jgi:hypothetical protein